MTPQKLTVAVFAALMLMGCNAGMEAQGPSPDEIRTKMATLPPQQQISLIRHSPMPKADQDKKIAEIEGKFGVKEEQKKSTG